MELEIGYLDEPYILPSTGRQRYSGKKKQIVPAIQTGSTYSNVKIGAPQKPSKNISQYLEWIRIE